MLLLKSLAAGIAATLISAQTVLAQPVPLKKEHAYTGPRRPAAQLATVYGKIVTNLASLLDPLRMTFVCEVDGKSYRGMMFSSCPSIVYLLPGSYRLTVHHGRGNAGASGTISAQVAAGRVYEVEVESAADRRVSFRLREMPAGFVLTYKDVQPSSYAPGRRENSRIGPAAD